MYLALRLACVALFWLSVPLLLVYRGLRSDIPWIFVIVSATVLGWILSNASVFFQHAAVDEDEMNAARPLAGGRDGSEEGGSPVPTASMCQSGDVA